MSKTSKGKGYAHAMSDLEGKGSITKKQSERLARKVKDQEGGVQNLDTNLDSANETLDAKE